MANNKILLVADIPGWAFDNDINSIIKHSKYKKFLDKCYSGNVHSKHFSIYKAIYYMNWADVNYVRCPYVSAGVFSLNYILRDKYKGIWRSSFRNFKSMTAACKILYDKIFPYNDRVFYASEAVDPDMFYVQKKPKEKKFIVGWVAKKTKGGLKGGRIDMKGYESILLPLMDRMKKHDDIEFKVNTSMPGKAVRYKDMPKFYKDIDCQICTSLGEGAPNPMFEAASCGKALISTRVGAIAEFIKHGENGFIIDSYTREDQLKDRIDQFERYILQLRNDRDLCEKMGERSRELIEEDWTWDKRIRYWDRFFEFLLSGK